MGKTRIVGEEGGFGEIWEHTVLIKCLYITELKDPNSDKLNSRLN